MSEEARLQKLFDKVKELEYQLESVEKEIKAEIKLRNLDVDNRLHNVEDDVSSHRKLWVFLGSAFGLGVIGAILKAIGL